MPLPQPVDTGNTAHIRTILARAFDDDPVMRWLFPDDATRPTALGEFFGLQAEWLYGPYGHCEFTDFAAALWAPPGAHSTDPPPEEWARQLLGERAPRLHELVALIGEHAPAEPHWYLGTLGTDPAAQGQGHGAALLRSGLAKADAAGLPAYLESSAESNLPFYAHFGFVVEKELQLPGGGPRLWPMRREARG
ncbi:GNAT family N-acetyltransferase [Streptomyces orinoci]|uniref:GNAT family N-acetyltransferase n=1 Tax=Streptomyces orinoci TaxID=67339 RepID=A0ABV3JSR7_STRON|nr:GNAT family N-acetyltransferase [Streptomyces orinoci]